MLNRNWIALFLFAAFFLNVKAQIRSDEASDADSLARQKALHKKLYSGPRKATILSAIIPGLGQVYNRKYWKLPIIYAGLGGFGYMFYFNNSEYNNFRQQVIAANDDNPDTEYDKRYTPDQLQTQKLYYRKYRDFALIGVGIIYLVNIIDANVDAHLKTFDVSDNLSMNVNPWYNLYSNHTGYNPAAGVTVKLNFK